MAYTHEEASECCPRFNKTLWDEKVHEWHEKPFIKDTVPQLFHRPFKRNLLKTITRMWHKAQESKATVAIEDFLLLAYDPSPWKSELYMSVTNEVYGIENVKFTGTYISKVFDGHYNKVPEWIKEMDYFLSEKGETAKRQYFYFTTCPRCAIKYGHNYVVALAEI